MSKYYKKIVNKYIDMMVRKEGIDIKKASKDDLLFYAFLDLVYNLLMFCFIIFAFFSIYFFMTREVLPFISGVLQ